MYIKICLDKYMYKKSATSAVQTLNSVLHIK